MSPILLQGIFADEGSRWIAIGATALVIVYLVLRPMAKRKDPLDRSAPPAGLAKQRGVEREMTNLLVELSEMSRQITAQLDTRAAKLEILIREADERIATLRSLSEEHAAAPAVGRAERAALEESREFAGALTQALAPAAASAPIRQPPPPASDPRHAEIYALADDGHDAHQIAGRLGRPRGEVELILALRARE